MVLAPGQAAALGLNRRGGGDLVVVRSTTLRTGERYPLDAAALTVGRSGDNDLELRGDQYARTRYADGQVRFTIRRPRKAWRRSACGSRSVRPRGAGPSDPFAACPWLPGSRVLRVEDPGDPISQIRFSRMSRGA